jgi:hypothetical protein
MGINQPPRPGNKYCKYKIINRPGHPSFKRRGEFFSYPSYNPNLRLTALGFRGEEIERWSESSGKA